MEYLIQQYQRVKMLRDLEANQIAAALKLAEYMRLCRVLAALDHDIRRERFNPPSQMVVQ
jgi:hypothetical protein